MLNFEIDSSKQIFLKYWAAPGTLANVTKNITLDANFFLLNLKYDNKFIPFASKNIVCFLFKYRN